MSEEIAAPVASLRLNHGDGEPPVFLLERPARGVPDLAVLRIQHFRQPSLPDEAHRLVPVDVLGAEAVDVSIILSHGNDRDFEILRPGVWDPGHVEREPLVILCDYVVCHKSNKKPRSGGRGMLLRA